MHPSPPQLLAHKGLRGEILLELKRAQPLTVKQLSAQLGVSTNAVRHHLKELEAVSLVAYGREQHGVGAPTYAYRLSPAGEALFPQRYKEALTQLLERVVAKEGRGAVVELFEEHYRDLARKTRVELGSADASERVAMVADLMTEAGYMAEWQESAGSFRLSEHNCAIRAVAERFPEVCVAEENFLRDVLEADVERRSHIASGCNACEYAISFGGLKGPAAEGSAPPQLEQP